MCQPRLAESRKRDRHQAIIDAVVVGQDRPEHAIRERHRLGLGLDRDGPELFAGRPEHVPDGTIAVVHAVVDRLGEIEEAPHQVQRQVGTGGRDAVDDHRSLQVEVADELPLLPPIHEGSCGPQRGDALRDLGGDAVLAGLGRELQAEAPFHLGIFVSEPNEDLGQPLHAERDEVVPGDSLLRCCHALASGSVSF